MPLPDWLAEHKPLLNYVPFLATMAGERATDKAAVARLIENALVAAVAAGFVLWRNDSVQDYRLETIQADIRDNRAEVRADLAQLRAEIQALRVERGLETPSFTRPRKERLPL